MPKRAKELSALAVKNLKYKPNAAKDGRQLPSGESGEFFIAR